MTFSHHFPLTEHIPLPWRMIQSYLPSRDFYWPAGANTDQHSVLPGYKFLSQNAQNTTQSIPLMNPEWCMRHYILVQTILLYLLGWSVILVPSQFQRPTVPAPCHAGRRRLPHPPSWCQMPAHGNLWLLHAHQRVAETQPEGNNWHRMRSGQMPPLL